MKKSLIVLVLFAMGCSSQKGKTDGTEDEVKPLVERIALEDLQGNPIKLEDLKGKVVFLNYWATWCKPCIKEMPSIDMAVEQLKNEPVVFIAASDEDLEKIKTYTSRFSYKFQFAHSVTSVFDLDIKALPTTFIISPEGEIVFNEMGGRDWSTKTNQEMIKSFIK